MRLNRVYFTGNIGSINETNNGIFLSIAINGDYKTDEGWKERTYWVSASLFGNRSRKMKGIGKGDKVVVEGELQSYSDERNHTKMQVNIKKITKIKKDVSN